MATKRARRSRGNLSASLPVLLLLLLAGYHFDERRRRGMRHRYVSAGDGHQVGEKEEQRKRDGASLPMVLLRCLPSASPLTALCPFAPPTHFCSSPNAASSISNHASTPTVTASLWEFFAHLKIQVLYYKVINRSGRSQLSLHRYVCYVLV